MRLPHHEVAHKRVNGLLESCWAILLKEKVSNPCKPVAEQWRCIQVLVVLARIRDATETNAVALFQLMSKYINANAFETCCMANACWWEKEHYSEHCKRGEGDNHQSCADDVKKPEAN